MSYTFSLTIDPACAIKGNRAQISPLRFETREEAVGYANKTFKPPQSVLSYDIIKVAAKPNRRLLAGKLEFIREMYHPPQKNACYRFSEV